MTRRYLVGSMFWIPQGWGGRCIERAQQCPTPDARPPVSAFDGGLKRSTQHVMSDARDGVDGRWVEDMFEGSTRWPRRSCGTAGGARSQFNRVARQLNERSRETLGFETRAERDLMLVLHRPIELTPESRHWLIEFGSLCATSGLMHCSNGDHRHCRKNRGLERNRH
jgi:hypothetical protein